MNYSTATVVWISSVDEIQLEMHETCERLTDLHKCVSRIKVPEAEDVFSKSRPTHFWLQLNLPINTFDDIPKQRYFPRVSRLTSQMPSESLDPWNYHSPTTYAWAALWVNCLLATLPGVNPDTFEPNPPIPHWKFSGWGDKSAWIVKRFSDDHVFGFSGYWPTNAQEEQPFTTSTSLRDRLLDDEEMLDLSWSWLNQDTTEVDSAQDTKLIR